MGNDTRPQQRLDRETTAPDQVLAQASSAARQLVGNDQLRITEALTGASGAQDSADAAQVDATQALADAAAAQSTANTAVSNAATAQTTANGKLSLLTDSTISTDADETFTATVSNSLVFHTGTLTADRSITLAAATDKWQARFTRTGAGAFNLSVGGLKNLATGTWCDVYYNGSVWVLMASGTL